MATVGYALGGCAVVMLALLALVVWEDRKTPEIRHPMAEDIPDDWC